MTDGDNAFIVYLTARARGMKSALLTRAQFDEMLEADTLQVMSDKLLNSSYETEMAEALTRLQGADAIEDALFRNFVNTFRILLRSAVDDENHLLARIFLTRWDLIAVKSLLRLRHQNLEAGGGMQNLIPGPGLGVALMEELAQSDSMASLVGGLIGWDPRLCSPLQHALSDYEQSRDLSILEEALDRSYFRDNLRVLKSMESDDARFVLKVLKMEIDRINMRILFSMHDLGHDKADGMSRLLRGGTIPLAVLEQMADEPTGENAMEHLGQTIYYELIEGVYQLAQSNRFSQMERMFERELLKKMRKAARLNALSIAVFMEFAWLKYNEVINLRLIARGDKRFVPISRIREEMVYV